MDRVHLNRRAHRGGTMKGERQRVSSPDVLRSAYEEVLKAEAGKAAGIQQSKPARRQSSRSALAIGTAVLLAAGGALASWVLKSEDPSPARSANSRQLMALALEIEDYRRSTGHLPASLGALRLDLPNVQYSLLPDQRYELRTSTGHHALVYRMGDSEPSAER